MTCHQELCRNWTGDGCACEVLDLEPDIVEDGNASVRTVRWYLGWPLALWRRRFPRRWTQAEVDAIHQRAKARTERFKEFTD